MKIGTTSHQNRDENCRFWHLPSHQNRDILNIPGGTPAKEATGLRKLTCSHIGVGQSEEFTSWRFYCPYGAAQPANAQSARLPKKMNFGYGSQRQPSSADYSQRFACLAVSGGVRTLASTFSGGTRAGMTNHNFIELLSLEMASQLGLLLAIIGAAGWMELITTWLRDR